MGGRAVADVACKSYWRKLVTGPSFVNAMVVGVVEAAGWMGSDVIWSSDLAMGVGADVSESVALGRVGEVLDGAVGADEGVGQKGIGWCRIEGGSGVDQVQV